MVQNGVTIQEWVSVDNDDKKVVKKSEWEAFYKEHTKNIDMYAHYDHGYVDALDAVDDWFDVQTSLQETDKWVSVDERLPEDGSSVFVMLTHTYESDYVTYGIARYIDTSNGERYWCEDHHGYLEWDKYSDGRGGCSSYKVTRWMPIPVIPQPPKGE